MVSDEIDLILFDVMMFKFNGMEIFKCLCEKWVMLVLMLIVKGEEIDWVIGLEFGVDDYLFKFFSDCELLVCICVILCCM